MPDLVRDRVGIEVHTVSGRFGLTFDDLARIGLRRNPNRTHLVVSRVLAKHVPVAAARAIEVAGWLAQLADDGRSSDRVVVIGFAETACGLGALVADGLGGVPFASTTRDLRDDPPVWLHVDERHSHAPQQVLLTPVRRLAEPAERIVIVDDELTTGATAWHLILQLDAELPGRSYVLACLIDARPQEQRDRMAEAARERGVDLRVVSLVDAAIDVPPDAAVRAASPLVLGAAQEPAVVAAPEPDRVRRLSVTARSGTDLRNGTDAARSEPVAKMLEALVPDLEGPTLVLGVEESMYLPILVAAGLGADVQSTTRSPALVIDSADYPIRSGVTFASAYDPALPAFLYNGPAVAGQPRYRHAVLVRSTRDQPSDGAFDGVVAAAGACCTDDVWVVDIGRAEGHG